MAGEKELVIKISGDVNDYKNKLAAAKEETEALSSVLDQVTKISAIGFAALTAEIGFSVAAFGEAEQASRRLTLALQNQGIYTDKLKESYKAFAESVSEKTGIDDDAITSAQAVAQGYLGQIQITQELTTAIADLSETMGGDLSAAAEKIGRTIGTSNNAFAKQGLELEDGLTKAQKMEKVLEFISIKAGGMAEQAGRGTGSIRGLSTAFGNFQEQIGKQFAPAIEQAVLALTRFFQYLEKNELLVKFTAGLIAGGTAIAALGVAIPVAINAFLSLRAALAAVNIALTATRLAVVLLAGATGIGLLLVGLSVLGTYLVSRTQELEAFKNNLPAAREEIKKLKAEIESIDQKQKLLPGGPDNFEQERRKKLQERIAAIEEITKAEEAKENEMISKKAALANKEAISARAIEKREQEAKQVHYELLELKAKQASEDVIAEKQKEADILNQIAQSRNEREIGYLEQQLETQRQMLTEKEQQDIERAAEFAEIKDEADAALNEQRLANTQVLLERETNMIEQQLNTRYRTSQNIAKQELEERVRARNQFLEDEKKFGVAYATINQAMHSAVYQGSKTAFGELAALQQSSNSTLKAIGKTAAIANIIIKTAESAMNIYAGFSTIPIVGPILGVAGAAAAVAFGAEQIGRVNGAAEGGLLEGGIPGVDSIPVMAQQGELVAPTQNFEEVIGSVRAKREADRLGGGGSGIDDADMSQMLGLLQSIDSKLSQPTQTVVQVNGDVLSDDAFLQTLAQKLSDGLEFGNIKIVGINA